MRKALDSSATADLIERFLHGQEKYPQEWNDFVESGLVQKQLEPYRRRCYELDPLVNRPEPADPKAMEQLRALVLKLRELPSV